MVLKPGSNLEARTETSNKDTVRTAQNPLPLQLQYSFSSAKLHRQYLHDTKIETSISTMEKKIPYCLLPF